MLMKGAAALSAAMHHTIFGRVHLVALPEVPTCSDGDYAYFSIDKQCVYDGFCDDFGPMNLGTIYQFCTILDDQLHQTKKRVALWTLPEREAQTNAAFLLGAYMMIRLGQPPSKLAAAFAPLRDQLVSFKDVSPGEQTFHLHLEDCWQGVWRARELGWVDFGPQGFNVDEYLHYDDPLNADLHEVVPGKFLAMKGPRSLPDGKQWKDRSDGYRDFSPAYYVDILHEFNVRAVVRLNEPQYDEEEFADMGIAVADLRFEDCTNPAPEIEAKFLSLAESLPGLLAVHCKAGLGRTGTLIALYLIKHHNFTARQAIGWLRVVRPGSVIGPQQHYLCEREAAMLRAGEAFRRAGLSVSTPALPPDATDVEVMDLVAAIISESTHSLESRGALIPVSAATAAAAASGLSPRSKDGGMSSAALAAHVSDAMERRNGRRGSPLH